MFIEKQITTNAVEKELSSYVRNMIWYIMEQKEEWQNELHYFEFDVAANEDDKPMQKVVHTYKTLPYQKAYLYLDEAPVKTSVVIKIEGSGIQTMMLVNELDMNTRNA